MLNNSEHITFSIQVILKKTTMNKRKICLTAHGNIFKSLAPFYYCLKIFGLACYSLDFFLSFVKIYQNIDSIFSIQVVPNYLLILIGDVLIFYSLALIYKSDAFSSTTVVLFIINNVYQSIPITISFHFGAVVVQMSQQMSIIMGKVITISDDKEVIERVSLFTTQNINHMTFMNLIFYS